jgi:outer membrane receptor protein involved in Fe transport
MIRGERWEATGAARLDLRHLEATHDPTLALPTQSRSFDAWSGRLGLAYHPEPAWDVFANVGRAFRSPTLMELYAHGPPPGRDRYELGDRDLGLEPSVGIEAGVAWRKQDLRSRVALHREQIDDYIELESSGESREGLPVFRYRAREATLLGGEAVFEVDATDWLATGACADYVRGQDETNDRPLSSITLPRWILDAEAHRASLSWASEARVRIEVEGRGRATRLGLLDRMADPAVLLHLRAEASWQRPVGVIRAAMYVDNLTDVRYDDYLARDPVIAPGQGRRVTVRVSFGS